MPFGIEPEKFMRTIWVGLLTFSACAGLAKAEGPGRKITSLLTLNGTCSEFVVGDKDYSDKCGNVVLTFSGLEIKEIHQGVHIIMQPEDTIIIGVHGRSYSTRAVGSCQYGDPFLGKTPVICEAHAETGRYIGTFLTDGRPPEGIRLH